MTELRHIIPNCSFQSFEFPQKEFHRRSWRAEFAISAGGLGRGIGPDPSHGLRGPGMRMQGRSHTEPRSQIPDAVHPPPPCVQAPLSCGITPGEAKPCAGALKRVNFLYTPHRQRFAPLHCTPWHCPGRAPGDLLKASRAANGEVVDSPPWGCRCRNGGIPDGTDPRRKPSNRQRSSEGPLRGPSTSPC